MAPLHPVLLDVLACPAPDHGPLDVLGDPTDPTGLRCTRCGRTYPVVAGIPALLLDEAQSDPAGGVGPDDDA